MTRHRRVFADRLVKQSERLSALHRGHGVFPNRDLGMVDESFRFKFTDDVAGKIAQPDDAVKLL